MLIPVKECAMALGIFAVIGAGAFVLNSTIPVIADDQVGCRYGVEGDAELVVLDATERRVLVVRRGDEGWDTLRLNAREFGRMTEGKDCLR